MSEKEINKMCSDIYQGEDWQPMKDYIKSLQTQLQQKENIIKEVRGEVRIYEEQSNDGTTNELDNYVFVQRLKKVLDKEVN